MSIFSGLRSFVGSTFDQLNPFDDGKTWQQRETNTQIRKRRDDYERALIPLRQKAAQRTRAAYQSGRISKDQLNRNIANITGDVNTYRPMPSALDNIRLKAANTVSENRIARPVLTGLASWSPTNWGGELVGYAGRVGQAAGWDNGKYLAQAGDKVAGYSKATDRFANRGFGDSLISGGITLAGDIANSMNPFAKAAVTSRYFTQSANDLAREMEATGRYSPQKSLLAGSTLGAINAGLERTGLDKITGKAASKGIAGALRKAGTSALTEGSTEAAQQFAENAARKMTVNPNQSLGQGVLESAAAGAILGGAASGAFDLATNPQIQSDVKDTRVKTQAKAQPMGAVSAEVKADPLYKQLNDRVTKAVKNMSEATGKLKENYRQEAVELIRQRNARVAELSQGGFIRLPGKETELAVTHNLSADNLAHAQQLGGIPQPSIGIVNPQTAAIDGFGDITLVGNNNLVDPKQGNKVFGADVYSPRQPKGALRGNTGTSKILTEKFAPAMSKYTDSNYLNLESSDSINESLANETAVMAQFLEDNKIKPKQAKLEINEKTLAEQRRRAGLSSQEQAQFVVDNIDTLGKLSDIDKSIAFLQSKGIKPEPAISRADDKYTFREQIRKAKLEDKFNQYVKDVATEAGATSKIFAGYTPSGTPRYLDETMDNVLKTMRKEKTRAGEGGFFGSSDGATNAKLTKQYRSLEQIVNDKDRLVTPEKMEQVKESISSQREAIQQQLEPLAQNQSDNQFTEYDNQMEAINDYLAGDKTWFEQKFPNAPESIIKKLDKLREDIKNTPTEYFESVPDRAVQLSEFEEALVPEGTDKQTLKILQDNGIAINFYKGGDTNSNRQQRLIELVDRDNQRRFPVDAFEVAKASGEGGFINIGKDENIDPNDSNLETLKQEARKFTSQELNQKWGDGGTVNVYGKDYTVHKMSYGQYFLEPKGFAGGEMDGFASETKWLNREKDGSYRIIGDNEWDKQAVGSMTVAEENGKIVVKDPNNNVMKKFISKDRKKNIQTAEQFIRDNGQDYVDTTDLYNEANKTPAPKRSQLSGRALSVPSSSKQIGEALGLTDEQMAKKSDVLDAFPRAKSNQEAQSKPTPKAQVEKSSDNALLRLGKRSQETSRQDTSKQGKPVVRTKGQVDTSLSDSIPEIENDVIGHPTYDIKKKVSILDKIRTPDRVLQKIGLGDVAEKLKRADNNYKRTLPKEIDKITKWYERVGKSDEASTRIFKYLDGQKGAKSELQGNELEVANEMKAYLKDWADRLNLPKDSRITNYITHIFDEQLVSKEFDPDLEKLIADKVPGSVYDPFTLQRLGARGYVEDAFRALDAYVKRGTRKENMDPVLAELSDRANELDKSGLDYVKQYADRINMRPTDLDNSIDIMIKQAVGYKLGQRPVAKITRAIRRATYRATLGLNVGSAVRNLTQGINTFAEMGGEYTTKGYYQMIKNWNSGELQEVGVLDNSFIEDRAMSAKQKAGEKMDKVLFAMFEGAEKVNRGAAYYAAKQQALDKGASLEQAVQAGIDTAAKTQFTFGRVNTPLAMQSDISKLFTQFQSFNVKQGEFMIDMAKNKEYAKMMRFASATALVFALMSKALGYRPEDMIPFGSNIKEGKLPIGAAPVFRVAPEIIDFGKAVFSTPSENAKTDKATKIKEAGKDLFSAVGSTSIPAFVQAKKTYGGIKAYNEGEMKRWGEGTVQIEQTPQNLVKGAVFGPYTMKTVETPSQKTVKTGVGVTRPDGQVAISATTEKDASGKFVSRSPYDAVINAYQKSGDELNIGKYDPDELRSAIRQVSGEAQAAFDSLGLDKAEIKFDSRLAQDYAKLMNTLKDANEIEADDATKKFFRGAYNSQLTEIERDLYKLSEERLYGYIENGTLSEQNVMNALRVERQLYDAGLINKETLARKLDLEARGYKTAKSRSSGSGRSRRTARRSGGRSGGGSSKGVSIANLKKIIALATSAPQAPSVNLSGLKAPSAKLAMPSAKIAKASRKGRQYSFKIPKIARV